VCLHETRAPEHHAARGASSGDDGTHAHAVRKLLVALKPSPSRGELGGIVCRSDWCHRLDSPSPGPLSQAGEGELHSLTDPSP
jgi:hypothetical protein